MKIGRIFFISLFCGCVTFVLLIVSMNMPLHMVFETKPLARLVLLRGTFDNWTAEQLGLEQSELDFMKSNRDMFLERNRIFGESESSDSDENDHEADGSSSLSSSDEEGGVDSDPFSDEEEAMMFTLDDAPVSQNFELGLFRSRVCGVSQNGDDSCLTVATNQAIVQLNRMLHAVTREINMPMWNNLRVEALFSVLACAFGLLFLFASLRPCCHNERMPEYLSALSFFAAGVLIFIPIVRLLLVSSDFDQNMHSNYNVTTKQLTSWSLVISGLAVPLAFAASLSMITREWKTLSKKIYNKLKTRPVITYPVTNGHVEMSDVHAERNPPAYVLIDPADDGNLLPEKS
ncbi:hypothetical protein ACF0H5_006449 [Mactra antiquata]